MASSTLTSGSRSAALFALAALVCEVAAWWWVGLGSQGSVAKSAVALGLLGIGLAMAAAAVFWRRHQTARRELQSARTATARALENEQALERAQKQAAIAHQLLVAAIDVLPIGISIFDQNDRQVVSNKYLDNMFPGLLGKPQSAQTFESIERRMLDLGLVPQAIGREDEWLAERLDRSDRSSEPQLQRFADDRWVHTYDVRTRLGYTVVARTDVTDLVRKEQQLEQAIQQLSRQSATDSLTGIANRRRFDETLANEWLRAARAGSSLSLLMVDIDHFKRFNDHYGHVAGDENLRRVALVLQRCVRRAGELLARYGGEEFVLLLPGTDLDHAEDSAQRCLDLIRREALPHVASPTASHVTFSIGVAHVFPDAATGPDSLVNAADTAMYRAKTAGRAGYAVADLADWQIDKDAPRSQTGDLE